MIVITGPGRSGTSFLADLYRNLGFDPGGGWDRKIRAGREHPEIVALNTEIIRELRCPVGPPPSEPIGVQEWHRIPELATVMRDRLCEVASRLAVVKDPRFCWTLRVWFAAGAPIEHVVVTMRKVEDIQHSAGYARMANPDRTPQELDLPQSRIIFRMGSLVASLASSTVSRSILWFPHYLDEPDRLYDELRFPEPVERARFLKVFRRTVNPRHVHFGRSR